ncbi:MAG: group 1 truncated hemoglobin [Methylotenera sp.]|uniref:group I truncated hemoglobin n=1 Tax=Methylotenera sp. TaxID=2051956 RepID=UPI002487961D|nr:group 1 truncated hemoglobin [Methylotenera sp.]MDI1309506.1 group 1 truncated hemoglobin [Methylotenera sp.]
MNFKIKTLLVALFASTALMQAIPAMSAEKATAPVASPNLGNMPMEGTETFKAFGGKEGLVNIMDDFMIGLIADPRTKPFFDNPKKDFIKAMLVEQMCELMNGGCRYSGRDMTSSHANMKVNREAFNALVEQFQFAMDKHNVPFSAQNNLLAKLAPMYREIETTKGVAVPPTTLSAQ